MYWSVDSAEGRQITFQLEFSDNFEVSAFRMDRDVVIITLLNQEEFGGSAAADPVSEELYVN